jgi:eukaryotic-like serine/threonine-protein kinase
MPHVTPLHADDPVRVGRYRLAGHIVGMPSSGSVFLGRDMSGGDVTISMLEGDWTGEAAERDRFTQEANAARRVAPYCAARILGSGFDGGRAFLVSEHVAGPSLEELVTAGESWRGRDLEALAIGTATGLASVHEAGLVHGEFDPAHVVLGPDGPRVIEFGISPPYGSATPSADMREWARTVLYAAAGRPAGTEDLALLPEPLRAVAAQCLLAEPGNRPSARSAVTDLIGPGFSPAGALAEGSRRATAAAVDQPPAPARGPAAAPGRSPEAAPGRRPAAGPGRGPAAAIGRRPGAGLGRGPATPPRGRTRRTAAIFAVVMTICVLAVLAVYLAHAAGSQRPGTAARGSVTTPAGRAAPPVTVPNALAGTWSGQVTQSGPADVFSVRVTLAPGSTGGTVSYSGTSLSCSGELAAVSGTQGSLKLDQAISHGPCVGGTITLTTGSADTLGFSFHGKSGPTATGTLSKAS